MKITHLILSCLLTISAAFGGDFVSPMQKINGTDKPYPFGELVNLTVSTVEENPEHLASSSYDWIVFDLSTGEEKRFTTCNTDQAVFFGTGIQPKSLSVYCVATHLYIEKDGESVKNVGTMTNVLKTLVHITDGGEPKPTPPGPNPGPNPEPVIPDSKFGLTKTIYELSLANVKDKNSLVRGAAALETSFEGMASASAAGTISSVQDLLVKTDTSNHSALKASNVKDEEWKLVFKKLMEDVYEKYQSGKISKLADFEEAWHEIAAGFKIVKGVK